MNTKPGHYISLKRNAPQADFIRPLSMPGVVGVQKRYLWNTLQSGHTFTRGQLLSDLNLVEYLGGKLVVFIEDKTFTNEFAMPPHLSEYEHKNKPGGHTAARWNPVVAAELQSLCAAIYQSVGEHPGFGGIALQESAPGLSDEALDASGYDPDVYIRTLIEANCDYLYLNYIPRAQERLGEVIAGTKAMVGGPDLLPDSAALQKHVHQHFRDAPNFKRLFGAVQFDDYASGWALDNLIMWATSRYPDVATKNAITSHAGDGLRVETLFWNDKTWDTPTGSYTVEGAYIVIAKRPVL